MTLTVPPLKQALSRDQKIQRLMMAAVIAILSLSILFPLYAMLSKSLENKAGDFIGADNFATFLTTPALYYSFTNSLWVALLTTAIVLVLAFFYAFALTRTCMPFKPVFKAIAFIPLLSPSLLSGISLVYWFGNKGVAKGLLFGESIYGPVGIIIGSAYWVFPDGPSHRALAQLRDHHLIRGEIRHHLCGFCGVYVDFHRFRGAESHRRQLQYAGHRCL